MFFNHLSSSSEKLRHKKLSIDKRSSLLVTGDKEKMFYYNMLTGNKLVGPAKESILLEWKSEFVKTLGELKDTLTESLVTESQFIEIPMTESRLPESNLGIKLTGSLPMEQHDLKKCKQLLE